MEYTKKDFDEFKIIFNKYTERINYVGNKIKNCFNLTEEFEFENAYLAEDSEGEHIILEFENNGDDHEFFYAPIELMWMSQDELNNWIEKHS